MEKIPTIFIRNPEKMSEVLKDINPVCQWVFDGEGFPTRKYDGTCVLIESDGTYYKRREVKPGKNPPRGFISVSTDPNTGKTVGWINVDPNNPENKYHIEAFEFGMPSGTYELVGPKIQGNPEKFDRHKLVKHEFAEVYKDMERSYDGIKMFLSNKDIEGIVFHHPDGRMAKIKKRDFGIKR